MNVLQLAYKSLLNRWFSVMLTITAIAVSMALLLGVLRLRNSVKTGFTNAIAGTDLVVGARTGNEQLLLATVFHVGKLVNSVTWQTYTHFNNLKEIAWTVPLSFGDSHRGFEVVGTTNQLFTHYQYGNKQQLALANGAYFTQLFDVVIGAQVAQSQKYELNQTIILQHGNQSLNAHHHTHLPFTITGILEKTGTPIDESIFIQSNAFESMHLGYHNGQIDSDLQFSPEELKELDLQPTQISSFLVGLHHRSDMLAVQQNINTFSPEALTAASPGLTLLNLWSIMKNVETLLLVISIAVVFSGLISMLISLLTGIKERRREMAIFRSLGAGPNHIYALIIGESALITLSGSCLGILLLNGCSWLLGPLLKHQYGIELTDTVLSSQELQYIIAISLAGIFLGMIPAYKMYRISLKDGMTIKL